MAQKFTHTSAAPHIGGEAGNQRRFAASWIETRRGSSDNTNLFRFADEDKARLTIETRCTQDVQTSTTTRLTADQCEALAYYLLDAAADLRSFSAETLCRTAEQVSA